jgi:hypothetical protein
VIMEEKVVRDDEITIPRCSVYGTNPTCDLGGVQQFTAKFDMVTPGNMTTVVQSHLVTMSYDAI